MISENEIPFILKSAPLFEKFPVNVLSMVAGFCDIVYYEEQSVIFSEGDIGSNYYIVHSGQIQLFRKDKMIEVKSELDWFGEFALLRNKRWDVSAFALSDVHMVQLSQDVLFELMSENQDIARLIMESVLSRYRT